MPHHPTLLNSTCCTRWAPILHDVAWYWMMLNEVWFPSTKVVLYADHTEIHASAKDISFAENRVDNYLASTVLWWNQNGLISHRKKCEAILIGSKHAVKNTRPLQIVLDGKPMKQSDYFNYLGIYIDHCLTWSKHVTYIQSRVYATLKLLNRISSFLSRDVLLRT